jgi:hypothetical protein
MRVMRSEAMALAVLVTGCVGFEPSVDSDAGPPEPQGGADECETPPASCFEAWACPLLLSSAPARPDPTANPGLRFELSYEASDAEAQIELVEIHGAQVVRPSDGPFSPGTHSGAWAELRDANGTILYTRGFHELISEWREVPPDEDGGSPSQVLICPRGGALLLSGFPNPQQATELVLFQEPIDGERTYETVEFARFRLPEIDR